MKKGIFLAMLVSRCLISDLSLAKEQAAGKLEGARQVIAIEVNSQSGVESGSLLTTGTREKIFIDKQNMKIVMGPESVGEFNGQGAFRLMRGSAYFESKVERSFNTTNATIDFVGRLIVSFDHRERSTSTFVLTGEARVKNPYEADRTIKISRHQGSSLITGDVYPNLVRSADIAQTEAWLKGFHWGDERRKEFLRDLPKQDEANIAAAQASSEASSAGTDTKVKNNPLTDYYSAIYEERGVPASHEEYKAVEEKDSPEKMAAAKPAEVVMSPENAAIIPLPDNQVNFGMVDILNEQQVADEPKEKPQEILPARAIASVVKKVKVKRAPIAKSEEELVLERLRQVRGQRSPIAQSKRMPASLPQKLKNSPASASVVPDPVFDLSENF